MTTFDGNRVTIRGGAGAVRGDTGIPETHGDEGLIRTDRHPLQGNGGADSVGRYLGSTGAPGAPLRTHFFSAEATQGGASDSLTVSDPEGFNWSGDVGKSYAFNRGGHSGNIRPYDKSVHYGIPGAPMSDTPPKWHDRNYR